MATMTSLANVKDSRWLQLEVCREFQRNKCTRPDTECKFAHPASNVEVQNGRVIACYDSIKGRCNREKPPCKYFHPPQHLKDQLLINGRNHLALKNALLQQMPLQLPMPTAAPAGAATMVRMKLLSPFAANPYMPTLMASPYLTGLLPGMMATTAAEPTALMTPTTLISPQKRTDRLEVCREYQRGSCKRAEHDCRFAHPPEHVGLETSPTQAASGVCDVTVCMDYVKGRCAREQCRYFHPPAHLQAQLKARVRNRRAGATLPGIVQYKRPALEKSGVPVYQPSATAAAAAAYQQAALALQMQQQFVPVSFTGHPASLPRF
ncbi:muscleblind-like protein 1 [Galendromus occidentalis]|uniref:Muscleblind-like protein 1 n=1 Tax=Galendromus occidentalis TaxID=34638 RepID=A0AAJ7L5F0_9ACAR|nr:muscleblind-like protein 1 [Galendromus occidentalis]